MYPVLLSTGPLTVHTYGVFVALGFLAGLAVTVFIARREGIASGSIIDMGILILAASLLGSRALYVLMNYSIYLNDPAGAIRIWEGGLVFSGGLVASVCAAAWYANSRGLPLRKTGDVWAPGIAIGQAIGRLGCFMAGCCHGRLALGYPWAVTFTDAACLAPTGIPLHPTQLYSFVAGIAIFGILLSVSSFKKYDGQVLLWFVILHSTARLLVERYRGDFRGTVFGSSMTVTQLITLLMLTVAVAALFWTKNHDRKDGQ